MRKLALESYKGTRKNLFIFACLLTYLLAASATYERHNRRIWHNTTPTKTNVTLGQQMCLRPVHTTRTSGTVRTSYVGYGVVRTGIDN